MREGPMFAAFCPGDGGGRVPEQEPDNDMLLFGCVRQMVLACRVQQRVICVWYS